MNNFKDTLGIYLVSLHFVVVLVVFLMFVIGWFNLDLVQASMVIIVPLFASNTTLILSYVLGRDEIAAGNFSPARKYLSLLIPGVLTIILCAIIIRHAYRQSITLEDYTLLLGIVEAAFGIYIGAIVKATFSTSG